MSVTDVAYAILKKRGQAIHFKELMAEIMQVKAINPENSGRLIAQMHTEINLDSRFVHLGGGEWGLREWQVKKGKVVRIVEPAPARVPAKRRRPIVDEDLDDEEALFEEDEEELLDDEDADEIGLEDDDMDEEDED